MNISDIIKRHVAETPDKTAIIFEDRRISYKALDGLINNVADAVTKMGYKKGEVLSIFLPSLPELIIGYLGTVRAGVTVNLVNAMLQKTEVAYILNDCACKGVLTDKKRLPILDRYDLRCNHATSQIGRDGFFTRHGADWQRKSCR